MVTELGCVPAAVCCMLDYRRCGRGVYIESIPAMHA